MQEWWHPTTEDIIQLLHNNVVVFSCQLHMKGAVQL
jgi:hypothetical protein